jgi:hypothetical protein
VPFVIFSQRYIDIFLFFQAFEQKQHQLQQESVLNVDVQEFFPRVQQQVGSNEAAKEVQQKNEFKCDVPVTKTTAPLAVDLEQSKNKTAKSATSKASQQQQQQQQQKEKLQQQQKSLPPPLPVRATKKEIMEGTKSMEQQNINLIQKSAPVASTLSLDVEWNVIKKGKKVKIVKGDEEVSEPKSEVIESPAKKNISTPIEVTPNKTQDLTAAANAKPSTQTSQKSKKAKNKGKKKKPQHLMTKQQDGFEIIEPQFGNSSKSAGSDEDTIIDDDPTTELNLASEKIVENLELLIVSDETDEKEKVQEQEVVANELNEVEEVILKKLIANEDDNDAVIDISDEEICSKTSIEIDLAEIAQEMVQKEEPLVVVACSLEESVSEKKVTPKKESEKKKKNGKQHSGESLKEIEKDCPVTKVESIVQMNEEKIHKHKVIPMEIPQPLEEEVAQEEVESNSLTPTFDDFSFFADHKNIAELERDLIENLRSIDDGIDIKSPLINPLYDFPITTAVSKWLHERQNESFENLFHVQNFKKLSELYDECDDESDISESPNNSGSQTTDSDYGSDCQAKLSNGSPSSSKSSSATSAKFDKKHAMKGASKLRIVKESFCALM